MWMMAAARPPALLPLAELEPLSGARTAGLLALDGARIARQEPGRPQLGPVQAVGLHQRPRDAVPERARLPRLAAAVHVRRDVEGAEGVGGGERLLDVLHQRGPREVVAEGAAVDVPLARAGRQVHTGDAGLAPAHRLPPEFGRSRHALTFWVLDWTV